MTQLTPLTSERLLVIDALRGFALMGLFIVHAVEYFELYWYKPQPGVIHDTVFFLFGGKMAATFAVLFGVAVYTMLFRYEQRGIDFRGRLVWRFVLLIVMGYAHGLLYAGDILLHLGLLGLLLVAICRLPTTGLMLLVAFCFLQVPTLFDFAATFSDANSTTQQPKFWALSWRNFEFFASAPLAELFRYNATMAYENKWVFNFETGKFWTMAGYAISGLVLGRIHFFSQQKNGGRFLKTGLIVGLAASIIIYSLKILCAPMIAEGMSRWYFNEILGNCFNTLMVATGICLFVFVYRYGVIRRLQQLLVPCGRMSLTLYVSQSIVCVPIFYGFGLGWYAEASQLSALILGFVLWGLQMLFAHWWIGRYVYGPFEWGWRVLTLLRSDVPFRRL